MDTVKLNTPAFALSGGLPTGGTYSGAGITNGVLNPQVAGVGARVATYTYVDGNSCKNTATKTYRIVNVVNIDAPEALQFFIAPNPVSQVLRITLSTEQPCTYTLANTAGQVCVHGSLTANSEIDMSALSVGVYLLQIVTDKGIATAKVVKQ
jgi:hypothetical protein